MLKSLRALLVSAGAGIAALAGCLSSVEPGLVEAQPAPPAVAANADEEARFGQLRQRMVDAQLRDRDIVDPEVLRAMGRVPRHRFVPDALRDAAYDDRPLPIGHAQTISQPYVVAFMTQLIAPTRRSRVLDVGTGSGYQAAVLGELCKEVHSIEILKTLADEAAGRLTALGYKNITVRHGDGYRGWKEHAPFDGIIVAAAAGHVPQPLVDQLAPGGRLVIPVGRFYQELLVVHKRADGSIERRSVLPVAFVPMTGEAQQRDR